MSQFNYIIVIFLFADNIELPSLRFLFSKVFSCARLLFWFEVGFVGTTLKSFFLFTDEVVNSIPTFMSLYIFNFIGKQEQFGHS